LFGASGDADNAFVVNRAPLDIYPAAASRVYGDPNPPLTGDIQGEVYDENGKITAQYFTDALLESEITTPTRAYRTMVQDGSVAITPGSGVLLSNYGFDVHAHTNVFTILRRTLTGKVGSASH